MKKTRIDLLFGFLGSGKTTLAGRILREYGETRQLALIVNEFGDVGVDGEILKGNDIDVIQLSTGCLCCTLKGSLLSAIYELAKTSELDHIVIEATGIAEPEDLLQSFSEQEFRDQFELGPLVTVVDGPKFLKIRTMLGPFYEAQVEKSDYLILNKLDMGSTALFDEVREEVEDINPDALIRYAERCDIDLAEIIDGPLSGALDRWASSEHSHDDHDHDHDHHHGAQHAPAESFVLDVPTDISRERLETFFSQAPETLWRAKGFVRIDGADHLVQVAMGVVEITLTSPRNRHYLVFIGDKLDRFYFEERLFGANQTEAIQK